MKRRNFDTAYIVKCYINESGSEQVRSVAEDTDELITSDFARVEFAAAVHRKRREKAITRREANAVLAQFDADCDVGIRTFVPLRPAVLHRVREAFATLPPAIPLRSADAIHCASAVDIGVDRIHSNDRHPLGAASHFRLRAVDVTTTI